jgi:peptidoglycan/xylan/chitin deacetylase (PgdA/CDA1 family)
VKRRSQSILLCLALTCVRAWAAPPPAEGTLAPPGPLAASTLPPELDTPPSVYAEGDPSRLALLITDPDSRWLPLVHGLKAIGVPVRVVRDLASALKHRVVLVYPNLSPAALQEVPGFVERGGTLLVLGEFHRLFRPLLGVDEGRIAHRRRLDFTQAGIDYLGLADPAERQLRFGLSDEASLSGMGWAQLAPGAERLASYEDGQAALVRHRTGLGQTYVFGFNVATLLYRGQSGRDEWFARAYANAFEPTGDVFLRLLRKVYAEAEPAAVTLGTVPQGRPLTILVTHDVDFLKSVGYSSTFAEFERSQGIAATYFLQTKVVKDYEDEAFFDGGAVATMRQVAAMGHEVASHSVCHTPLFASLPLGDGQERYPEYRPFVHDKARTSGATLLGELRVSKYLIESMLPESPVVAFRPGYLANPPILPQALQATGYRYVSSLTAANTLSHLPFQQNRDRRGAQELPLYEFPVTMSDIDQGDFTTRLPAAQALAEQLARYGGTYVLLIHPNNLDDKLRFEKAFVQPWIGRAWFGTLGGFGRWWEARDRAGVDVALSPGAATIRLTLPLGISDLQLRVPMGWTQPAISQGTARAPEPGVVLVSAPSGTATLSMRRP